MFFFLCCKCCRVFSSFLIVLSLAPHSTAVGKSLYRNIFFYRWSMFRFRGVYRFTERIDSSELCCTLLSYEFEMTISRVQIEFTHLIKHIYPPVWGSFAQQHATEIPTDDTRFHLFKPTYFTHLFKQFSSTGFNQFHPQVHLHLWFK